VTCTPASYHEVSQPGSFFLRADDALLPPSSLMI
jgi:hypothetical protein